jgi:flagellar M-ring protein FliF
MGAAIEQIGNIFSKIPLQRKILMGVVLLLVIGGFISMFVVGSKVQFQPLYGKLSSEDAAQIVDKLKEQRVPFKLEGGGTLVMVPADQVYSLRLSLAGEGLPKGSGVGFEIFDKTDFGTTEFVQKLNYQRALQGELARTIKEFKEVADARVMIVMPKDSVFIEESKPPSASVMLKLRSPLSKSKVRAVVNLVASAVEGLTPDLVSVVDTEGHVLSEKASDKDKDDDLADSQLQYKQAYESSLAHRIQSMLEQIVGMGKAIVRVSADMDFSHVETNEEIYDPDVQVVRSRQVSTENEDTTKGEATGASSVSPGTGSAAGNASLANKTTDKSQRKNETVNYEINRTLRKTTNPVGVVKRLSVAAVIDGTYTQGPGKDGKPTRTYVARSQADIDKFTSIVRQAMGYNADRDDQVTVESLPFAEMDQMAVEAPPGVDWPSLLQRYGYLAGYAVLMLIAFIFLVRPVARAVGDVSVAVEQQAQLTGAAPHALPRGEGHQQALPEPTMPSPREMAVNLTKEDPDRAVEHVRNWLSEAT